MNSSRKYCPNSSSPIEIPEGEKIGTMKQFDVTKYLFDENMQPKVKKFEKVGIPTPQSLN